MIMPEHLKDKVFDFSPKTFYCRQISKARLIYRIVFCTIGQNSAQNYTKKPLFKPPKSYFPFQEHIL